MAKRSQRRPSRRERDQAGCISGFISIFDFRHGRSTRRLLADRRQVNKQPVGGGYSSTQTIPQGPSEECENDAEENKMPITDVSRTSVKELMEEEMVNEHVSTNHSNDSEMGSEQINSKDVNQTKKNHWRKNRSCNKSGDLDVSKLDEQKPSDNLDLEKIMEELAHFKQRNAKHDARGDFDIPSDEAAKVVEEKIVAAVKLFIESRQSKSKRFGQEGNSYYSKDVMDALQALSSDKGSFLKLLKDPNSVLVKHIQDLEDAQFEKDENTSTLPSEEKTVNVKSDDHGTRKPRNFFRRKSKSLESFPSLGEGKDCQSPNKIVILKPGHAGGQSPDTNLQSYYMDNKMQHEKNPSQFSFTEIKRKLRHAMGKERPGISPDRLILKFSPQHQNGKNGDKSVAGESFGWSSPNRNHFFTERFTVSSPSFKKGEAIGKLKENGAAVVNETSKNPRFGGSNLYIEAKKHLSAMLKNGDENAESFSGQLPKSLGRILSLPEYNGSPLCSPRKYGDDIFVTAQMRLSPRGVGKNNVNGLSQENQDGHPSPSGQNLESQPCISGSYNDDKVQSPRTSISIPLRDDRESSLEIQSFTEDNIVPEDQTSSSIAVEIEEATQSRPQEEEKINNISSESESSCNSINGDIKNGQTREIDNPESGSEFMKESSECFNSDFCGGDQILSSPTVSAPHSPVSRQVEDSECAIEKIERPSPVSVLEPLLTDEDVSPASTKSLPVEKEVQPRHIQFEEHSHTDQEICTRISPEDEESEFEYVEAVLLGSGLNWDEFLSRWLALYDILDSSLFDEVELFSSRARHDQKLLFDCANEALKEVCESHFRCFTGTSLVKQNIQPVPKGMDLINEVWKQVEWHLSQHLQPHSLDQLVRRDLEKSGKWMNLQSDTELLSFEMGDVIFDELVGDFVLSFVDDASQCEFAPMVRAESNAVEDTDL